MEREMDIDELIIDEDEISKEPYVEPTLIDKFQTELEMIERKYRELLSPKVPRANVHYIEQENGKLRLKKKHNVPIFTIKSPSGTTEELGAMDYTGSLVEAGFYLKAIENLLNVVDALHEAVKQQALDYRNVINRLLIMVRTYNITTVAPQKIREKMVKEEMEK